MLMLRQRLGRMAKLANRMAAAIRQQDQIHRRKMQAHTHTTRTPPPHTTHTPVE